MQYLHFLSFRRLFEIVLSFRFPCCCSFPLCTRHLHRNVQCTPSNRFDMTIHVNMVQCHFKYTAELFQFHR